MLENVPRVYFLGLNNLSKFTSYHLANHPSQPSIPEIVLILKTGQYKKFVDFNNSSITLNDYSTHAQTTTKKAMMVASGVPKYGNGKPAFIDNLVFGGSSKNAKELLSSFKNSIGPTTNILLLNGSRTLTDALYKDIFRNEDKRPNLYQCLNTHRFFGVRDFEVNLLGTGSLTIAKVPKNLKTPSDIELDQQLDQNLNEEPTLLKMLVERTELHATFVSYRDFELLQFESLIVQSCIDPLSTILNATMGDLLHIENLTPLLENIIQETTKILTTAFPHVLKNPYSQVALDSERLLDVILNVLRVNYRDSTRAKRNMDILKKDLGYETNGYLASLGRKHSIPTPINTLYSELMAAKYSLKAYKDTSGFNRSAPQL